MSFTLDNSVAMTWLLADGRPADMTYAAACPMLFEARSQAFAALVGRLYIVTDGAAATHALAATLHPARRKNFDSIRLYHSQGCLGKRGSLIPSPVSVPSSVGKSRQRFELSY